VSPLLSIVLHLIAGLTVAIGLLGIALPALPGVPLVFVGLLIAAWADGFAHVGAGMMTVIGLIAALSVVADLAATALGASRFGATRAGVAGAVIGSVVALVTGQIWLILIAPLFGAILGEYISNRDPKQAVRAGMGALVGMILGGAAKYALAITMIALFLVDRFWP
jgi:uncharacterized protein YqgC (DUF456 family)